MLRILLLVALSASAPAASAAASQPSSERGAVVLYIDGDTPAVKAAIAKFEVALRRRGVAARHDVMVRHVPVNVFNRNEATQRIAAALRDRPALLIATSSESAIIARALTSDLPIVFGSHQDPVRLALVHSLAEPGGNLTGFTFFAPVDLKRLELLREIAPRARRLGIVIDHWWMDETGGEAILRAARDQLGFEGRVFMLEKPQDLRQLETPEARAIDAWYVPETVLPFQHPEAVMAALAALRKPVMFPTARFTEAGGLAAYQAKQSLDDALDFFAKLAGLVLDGVPPGTIPVERPSAFELIVNADEAKRIGISLPDALLKRADRVVHDTFPPRR